MEALQEQLERERAVHQQQLLDVRESAMEMIKEKTMGTQQMLNQAIDDIKKDKARSAKTEEALKTKVASLSTGG